jgi:hypothetical protein
MPKTGDEKVRVVATYPSKGSGPLLKLAAAGFGRLFFCWNCRCPKPEGRNADNFE